MHFREERCVVSTAMWASHASPSIRVERDVFPVKRSVGEGKIEAGFDPSSYVFGG